MADKVEAPIVGGEVDPSDPVGSFGSIAMAVAGLLLGGVVVATAAWLWNQLATRTPDVVPEVEIA